MWAELMTVATHYTRRPFHNEQMSVQQILDVLHAKQKRPARPTFKVSSSLTAPIISLPGILARGNLLLARFRIVRAFICGSSGLPPMYVQSGLRIRKKPQTVVHSFEL